MVSSVESDEYPIYKIYSVGFLGVVFYIVSGDFLIMCVCDNKKSTMVGGPAQGNRSPQTHFSISMIYIYTSGKIISMK